MRNMHLEAAIWNFFTSAEFFEGAAREFEDTMAWFGTLAVNKGVANFGRNNQIYDKFKKIANNLRRGAELAKLDDYRLLQHVASCFGGDVRGIMEQPLHSWMTKDEYKEFERVRVSRLLAIARNIEMALCNAIWGAASFFDTDTDPDSVERRNDDDAFPGDEIVFWYNSDVENYKFVSSWALPDPLPEYVVDTTVACRTGDEVPWTGVWYPSTGLENYSLTFAIKGMRMQAAYRVVKTRQEQKAEGVLCPHTETVIEATTWHPLKPSGRPANTSTDLWAKAGQPCPKTGMWQPTDPGVAPRAYQLGELMPNLGSAYGFTIWKWIADR